MKLKFTALAVAVALAPMSALAGGMIDGFYTYSHYNVKEGGTSEKARGHGYGLRGAATLNDNFALTGLYQESFIKERKGPGKADLTETRVGIMGSHDYAGIKLLGGVEHVNLSFKERGGDRESARGYVAKVGGQIDLIDGVATHLTVGYVNLSERTRGYEVETGARVKLVDNISGFVDYRFTRLTGRDGGDKFRDNQHLVRVGAGYHF